MSQHCNLAAADLNSFAHLNSIQRKFACVCSSLSLCSLIHIHPLEAKLGNRCFANRCNYRDTTLHKINSAAVHPFKMLKNDVVI